MTAYPRCSFVAHLTCGAGDEFEPLLKGRPPSRAHDDMKHFEEILLALGAQSCKELAAHDFWEIWRAEYKTPVASVAGNYLYCRQKDCPRKPSPELIQKWRDATKGESYELVVRDDSNLSADVDSIKSSYRASSGRTAKELLYQSFLASTRAGMTQSQGLDHFIEPSIELRAADRSTPTVSQNGTSTLVNWLLGTRERKDADRKGAPCIGVLLADGGLGKTTLTRAIAATITKQDRQAVSVLIESEQWKHLAQTSITLQSIFAGALDSSIGRKTSIIANEAAFRVLVQEGLFVIVFDGFDEVCSSPSVYQKPREIIEELQQLVASEDEDGVKSRILLTARETFWTSIRDDISNIPIQEFKLRGFDNDRRIEYFRSRLPAEQRDLANRVSKSLSAAVYDKVEQPQMNEDRPSGIPFILDLVVDYVTQNPSQEVDPYSPNLWESFLEGMCRRDKARQELSVDPKKQIATFQEIFRDFDGDIPRSDLREYFETLCGVSDPRMLDRLENHVLLQRVTPEVFRAKHEPLRVYFLARYLSTELVNEAKWDSTRVVRTLARSGRGRGPVIEWMAGQLRKHGAQKSTAAVRHALQLVRASENPSERLEAGLTLFALVQEMIPDGEKRQRAEALLPYYALPPGSKRLQLLAATGVVKGFDFAEMTFDASHFIDVEFKNCRFGPNTIFQKCKFPAGLQLFGCTREGVVDVLDGDLSPEAQLELDRFLNKQSSEEVRIKLAEDVLRRALRKFRVGDSGFKTIQYRQRAGAMPPNNPYKEEIWDILIREGLLERHAISGVSEGGLNVADDRLIRKEIIAYFDNSLLGPKLRAVIAKLVS
jgi:hypothetical protein